jgi:hypothetical protein
MFLAGHTKILRSTKLHYNLSRFLVVFFGKINAVFFRTIELGSFRTDQNILMISSGEEEKMGRALMMTLAN